MSMPPEAVKASASPLPGLGLCAGLAVLAIALSRWPLLQQTLPVSALMLAIGLGAALGNLVALPASLKPGLTVALKKLLRLGIMLLGFKISLAQVQSLGWQSLLLLTICISGCFAFTVWLGRRLGLSSQLSLLLASGTSICGASAIAATDAVIETDEADTAYALATITLFGTLVKMTRVIFLIPVTVGLLLWSLRGRSSAKDRPVPDWNKVPIPWFVFGFLGVIGFHSLDVLAGTCGRRPRRARSLAADRRNGGFRPRDASRQAARHRTQAALARPGLECADLAAGAGIVSAGGVG